MKAIEKTSSNSLLWRKTPYLSLVDAQVRIKVHATAINRADLLQRRGRYPVPPGASQIMGLEMAGEIIELGERIKNKNTWKIGDRVCALLEGGGYAEEVVCDASMLLPIPENRSFIEAAAMPEAFYTAYLNIWIEGQCQPNDLVIVHAAASGVGTAAVQLCKLFQNPCLATASEKKRSVVMKLGATAFCAREKACFVAKAKEMSDGKGAKVILDLVGANYFKQNISAIAKTGRIILVGLVGGYKTEINLAHLLMKRVTLKGSVLRSRSRAEKVAITEEIKKAVWPHFFTGKINPVIDRVMPIQEVEAAHAYLASNQTIGKIVLRVLKPLSI